MVLGVGGGIAAYKLAFVASRLVQSGAAVRAALSRDAQAFIGAATFAGLTGQPAILRSTQIDPDGHPPHITASRGADVLVVAPATADLLARLAFGCADDAVTLLACACRCRRIVCPAMNDAMWADPGVQRNVATLRDLGWEVLGPETGWLAEGYAAVGRMVEAEDIVAAVLESARREGSGA